MTLTVVFVSTHLILLNLNLKNHSGKSTDRVSQYEQVQIAILDSQQSQ